MPAQLKQPESKPISISVLDFDKRNPRFPKKIAEGPIDALLDRFARDERLLEIVESIGTRGYFPGEPLLVVPNGKRFRVIEGNRRLAALKLLNGEHKVPKGRVAIADAVENAIERPAKAHCLVFDDEDLIVRYLGFRHITGIKSWGALQKARYMQRLMAENFPATVPYEKKLKDLAKETGTKAPYLGQMLTALALYERAELEEFYRLDVDPSSIDFSILSTALSYSNIVDYLELENRTDQNVQKVKPSKLKNLIDWLFVAPDNSRSVVGESRNLKKLAAVVSSPTAVKHLSEVRNLDEAFEFSKGPGVALAEALVHAERRLTLAWQWLPKVDEINSAHRDRAQAAARQANLIVSMMESLIMTKEANVAASNALSKRSTTESSEVKRVAKKASVKRVPKNG